MKDDKNHVWAVEILKHNKKGFYHYWSPIAVYLTREVARKKSVSYFRLHNVKTNVVKYITDNCF